MKLRYIGLVLVLSTWLFGCERESLTDEKIKILAGIKADPQLSKLSQAIERANLKSALVGTQYTFLAPTDDAFTKAGIDPNAIDPAALLAILQYHIIPSRIDSSRFGIDYAVFLGQIVLPELLGPLTYQGFQTINLNVNANLYCTNATAESAPGSGIPVSRGVFFNGARIESFDSFEGADGVVHKIDNVLLPPIGNFGQAIAADPDLSLFSKLVNKAATATGASSYATTTLSLLPIDATAPSRAGTLTVLAPTNAAMTAGGLTEAFIDGATQAACLGIARRHVFSLRNFSSDLFNQSIRPIPLTIFNTQQAGVTVTYGSDANGAFFSNLLTPRADIVKANIVTTNGVIHKISTRIN